MRLGRTKAGAAAHFPQATSEGNAPPGPPSLAKPLLPDTNTDTNHQQANREKVTLQSKAVGQLPRTDSAHVWQHHPAQSQAPACPSWPPPLLFSLSSKELSSHSAPRVTEITFSQELKCQEERHKQAGAGAFRNRKEVVRAVIYCGRFCSAIATYHYTSFILFHLADADSFPLFLIEHKPMWLHFKWFQTLPMAIKKNN